MKSKRPRRVTGPLGSGWLDGPETTLGRDHLFEQDGPADQGVAAVADARLHGQVEIAGFVDQAADFAGRLSDVDQQHVPATGNVILGHEGLLLVSLAPARRNRVRPRYVVKVER